ncbi:MAG: mannitol dehydrogenase family protein [Spirochaetaceae bacterium]|jgi:fructuronate reductase|nr:mannitol dehydrogenase family protein [Spirochaetaceae bacterium]
MLTINRKAIQERKAEFAAAGVEISAVSAEALAKRTAEAPRWAHFGAGNLFKAYHAMIAQRLIDAGLMDSGIVALVPGDFASIGKLYTQYDNLFLRVVMKADGTLDKQIISAVPEFLAANPADAAVWNRVKAIFANPSLQLVTITITEKGYALRGMDGNFLPELKAEFDAGPGSAVLSHAMTKLAALLYERFQKGGAPLALISTDNFSHNGDKLKDAILTVAREWQARRVVNSDFVLWLDNPAHVGFPLSMIDKITPYASESVQKQLAAAGLGGMEIVKSGRGSVTAPFVNTEEAEYLIIEDAFPNGRPPLEKGGVYITTREKVDMVERMKVCTCLNPLHTALAVFGCLLGYTSIAAEMKDACLKALVEKIAFDEGMPVVTDPGIIKPAVFVDEVLNKRLPNPNIPDTPQRIATDTSQKLAPRFGETIKAYKNAAGKNGLDVTALKYIPLTLAAWCRYLLGVDDAGKPFTPSPDPLLSGLQKELAGTRLGEPASGKGKLKPVLSNKAIFGSDLYEAGLGEKIERYFEQMLEGPGAVRKTLQDTLAKGA